MKSFGISCSSSSSAATAVSLAVLLATFMGGLCLGSLALPRIVAARDLHPLRVFAVIELGIGLCGILVSFGVPLVSRVYVAAVGHGLPAIALRAIICSICLLIPTLLMGASLPAIARWIKTTQQGVGRIGLLYAANTAGAVFGSLLTGFYLLRVFDGATATYVAAFTNAAVALISFGLSLRSPNRSDEYAAAQPDSPGAGRLWPIYLAIALSGACALGAEVVWTRLLTLILGTHGVHVLDRFSDVPGGVGTGQRRRVLASRYVRPQAALGYCQFAARRGHRLDRIRACQITSLTGTSIRNLPRAPGSISRFDLARAIWAILPPTLLWGASFPLALAAVASRENDPARPVAAVYVANTGGAILGALSFQPASDPQRRYATV